MVARLMPALRRGIILLAVWVCALIVCAKATQAISDHGKMSAEVAVLEEQYNARVQEYAGLLAEGEKIASDPEKQVGILKDHYGYTLPDETPIVILNEQTGKK